MTPLRCLLFSSTREVVQPIWQVLADLGIEGEHCESGVDAVEKVTTQMFQIVITDWDDQPEAAFLLKTARDVKAAARPLTLAIVGDDAKRPEALQAGANSILLKPIRPDQVRDTMSTACELLRAKLQPAAPTPSHSSAAAGTLAAAASASAASVPASVTQSPEKLRAGEFLQSSGPTPGAQFDTESEFKTLEETAAPQITPVAQLEPTAAALDSSPAERPMPPGTLTGWAMLQARLTKSAPPEPAKDSARNELLSYGDPTYKPPAESPRTEESHPARKKELSPHSDSDSESALFAHIPEKPARDSKPPARAKSRLGKIFMVVALAVACVALGWAPASRQRLQAAYQNGVRIGVRLLNPPPAPLPQAVAVHDSFGQWGDEYKLPVPTNIPDATTDPSQIRVVPIIDPTVKQKSPETTTEQEQAPSGASGDSSPDQTDSSQNSPDAQNNGKAVTSTASSSGLGNAVEAAPNAPPAMPVLSSTPPQKTVPRIPVAAQHSVVPHVTSASVSAGIPSSLKSQIASSTPQSSGAKPIEAAMSSIEPVSLSEAEARGLLAQPVDPQYPASARASGQRGSVVLQVLIGRDGAVQDAKFLQGSLVFARTSIDAVKQWRFKPYSFNGRPVSVQTVITLNFKPTA